jgi:hypothetical protein
LATATSAATTEAAAARAATHGVGAGLVEWLGGLAGAAVGTVA